MGGGILGTFHAYHALLQGHSVILLEKNKIVQGATVRNFGQIVPSGMDSKWQAYGRESLDIYKKLQSYFDISVREEGTIYLASDQEEMQLLAELRVINQKNDYPSELWSKAKCLKAYPNLKPDYVQGALYFPEEVNVSPSMLVHRVQDFLVDQYDLVLKKKTKIIAVEAIENKGCKLRDNYGQEYAAEKVLICNGTDFQTLYPALFEDAGLLAVKLQMLQTHPQSKVNLPGSILTGLSIRRYEAFAECPSYADIKAKEPAQSLAKDYGVHILFKQERDGSVIIGDTHEYADARDQDELDFAINERMNDFVIEEAQKIFHLDNWSMARRWSGFYSQCKDSDIFTYDLDNKIHIVTGIGGKGMTGSPGFAAHHIQNIL